MRSIRSRVLILAGVAMAMTFIAAALAVYVLARRMLYDQFDGALTSQVQVLAAQVEEDEGRVESEIPVNTDRDVFELWANERVVAKSAALREHDLARNESLQIRAITLPDGKPARQVTFRFRPRVDLEEGQSPTQMTAVLVLARPTAELEAGVHGLGKVLIIVGAAGTLISLLLLMLVSRLALAPIRSLADSIATIKADALELKLRTPPPAELQPIVDRLQDVTRRLAKAFARERQLTAEIAHELRTPLTGLRATIEVALERERPAERYRGALNNCLAITKQTESTVQAMLLLARLDAGNATVTLSPVEVDVLVREVLAPHALAPRVPIETVLSATRIDSDPDLLRIVVQNLVDNALSYCDDKGHVAIALRDRELIVSNTGCSLDPSDLQHVFDRFWRKDTARTAGHVGLGLSLCRHIMDALGGTITVAVVDSTFTATVRL